MGQAWASTLCSRRQSSSQLGDCADACTHVETPYIQTSAFRTSSSSFICSFSSRSATSSSVKFQICFSASSALLFHIPISSSLAILACSSSVLTNTPLILSASCKENKQISTFSNCLWYAQSIVSLIPSHSHHPVYDCLRYVKMEGEDWYHLSCKWRRCLPR